MQMKQTMPFWLRTLIAGSVASVASSAVIVIESKRRTGNAATGTNATSQWIWGRGARRSRRLDWRHTFVGYLIHHASSVFWAAQFESKCARRLVADDRRRAALVAGAAAIVDYGVMPRRFTPGFESRLPAHAIAVAYAAFGLGLWLGAHIHGSLLQSPPSRLSRPRAAGPLMTRPSHGSKRDP